MEIEHLGEMSVLLNRKYENRKTWREFQIVF